MAELDIAINPAGAVRGGNVVKQMMRDLKDMARGTTGDVASLGNVLGRTLGTGPAAAALGVAALGTAMVAAARSTASYVAELKSFALQTNLSVQEAQLFTSVAARQGLDMNTLKSGVAQLNQQIQDAAKGSGDAQRQFGALGVAFLDTRGKARNTGEVFEDVIGHLGDFKESATKTSVVSKLLGDNLQGMARMGREELASLGREMKNNLFTPEQLSAADRYKQQMDAFNATMEKLKHTVGNQAIPVLLEMSTLMNTMGQDIGGKSGTGGFGEWLAKQVATVGVGYERAKLLFKQAFTADAPSPEEFWKKWEGAKTSGLTNFHERMAQTASRGASGSADMVLPPDPAVRRRMLEEEIKQEQDVVQRSLDLYSLEQDTKLALLREGIASRRDMETTELKFLEETHSVKMVMALNEQQKIQELMNLEEKRFAEGKKIGGVSDDERKLQAMQHVTVLADLQGKLSLAQQKTELLSATSGTEYSEAFGKAQEDLGRRIVESLQSNYQIGEDLRHRDQDNALAYYQNLAKFQEAYGTSRENQMTTEYDMVRANLAKQLDVNQQTAEKVLNAWRNGDNIHAAELLEGTKKTWDEITTIMLGAMADQRAVSEKFSDDVFAGFGKSMHKYVTDQSMFGFGADQARSVAQAMQQGFKTYFFDAMEGRIKSFKDVVSGLTDFAKNILSDVSSKLITRSILGGIDQLMSGGGSIPAGGFNAAKLLGMQGFAVGGVTNRPAIFGESGPEAAVPLPDGRSIPVRFTGAPYGMPNGMMSTAVQVPVNVQIENHTGATVDVQRGPMNKNGVQDVKILIHQTVQEGMRDGVYDNSMKQFGNRRQPARRG